MTAALAGIGLLIALYLTSVQLGVFADAWDPFFGGGSDAVLHSRVARSLPFPDAALGVIAYLAELVLDLWGDERRYRTQRALVLTFGAVVAAMAAGGIVLTALQGLVVMAWCTLCLSSALLSWIIAAIAWPEVRAAWRLASRGGQKRLRPVASTSTR